MNITLFTQAEEVKNCQLSESPMVSIDDVLEFISQRGWSDPIAIFGEMEAQVPAVADKECVYPLMLTRLRFELTLAKILDLSWEEFGEQRELLKWAISFAIEDWKSGGPDWFLWMDDEFYRKVRRVVPFDKQSGLPTTAEV